MISFLTKPKNYFYFLVSFFTGAACTYHFLPSAIVLNRLQMLIKFAIIFACVTTAFIRRYIHVTRYSLSFSVIYSAIMISGNIYSVYDTLHPSLTKSQLLYCIFQFGGYIILFLVIYGLASKYIDKCKKNSKTQDKQVEPSASFRFCDNKKYFIFGFTLIFYCLCLYILRPNIATYDSANQITQAFGWIPLANNNPFLHTLLLRCILLPSFALTGDTITSIFVLEVFSVIVFSLITTSCILFFEKKFDSKKVEIKALELFYFLNPLICWYVVVLWKDIWISYFVLLFVISLYNTLTSTKITIINSVKLFILSFTILSFKGTGILYIGILLFAIILYPPQKIKSKNIISITFGTSIIVYLAILLFAYTVMNIEKHFAGDTQSLLWQTLGRTAKYHSAELSDEDYYNLDNLIDIDKAVQLYDSRSSDPIKGYCLDYDYFKNNKLKCFLLWTKLACKYPRDYIDAIYGLGYGYYYPNIQYWVFPETNYVTTLQNKFYQETLKDPYINTYNYDFFNERSSEINSIKVKLNSIRSWPVIGRYASIGSYSMLYLVLCLYSIENRIKYKWLYIAIPFSVFIGCVFSPVFAEMRYYYPAALSLPIFIGIVATSEHE